MNFYVLVANYDSNVTFQVFLKYAMACATLFLHQFAISKSLCFSRIYAVRCDHPSALNPLQFRDTQ